MLQALPIDLTDEQRKGQMKKSQIGHVVMFLSKPEVENNRANRRIARVTPASQADAAPSTVYRSWLSILHGCKQLGVILGRRGEAAMVLKAERHAYALLLACWCLCSSPL